MQVVREAVERADESLTLARQMTAKLGEALDSLSEALTTWMADAAAIGHPTEGPAAGTAAEWSTLSKAEQEVATLAAEGHTNAEISERLFVSVNTVKTHLRRVFSKLNVRSRRGLTRLATRRTR